jgi:hypothetical protein
LPWAPSNLLRNNLSVASRVPTPVINKPTRTLADLTGVGAPPAAVLDAQGVTTGGSIMRFPNEPLMYYMKISMYKYTRTGWNTIGSKDYQNTVVLPLAMQLIDNQNVKYSDEPLGVSGAIGLGLGSEVRNIANDYKAQGAEAAALNSANRVGSAAASSGASLGISVALSAAASQVGTTGASLAKGVGAAAGMVQNEFLTVMLEGPNYKVRDFQWCLSPNNPAETEALRKIIQLFNNAQAPTLSRELGYAFFQYPNIFQIEFKYGGDVDIGDIMFRMRPMVLLNAQYNYTPHGVYAPFTSTHGPNAIELQLKFQELELWVNNSETDQAYRDGGISTTINPIPQLFGATPTVVNGVTSILNNIGDGLNAVSKSSTPALP